MLERSIAQTQPRQKGPARPNLSLTWRLDPATGKPVARWTINEAEEIAETALRPAA
jgi:hypothetical protein